jgi:hypothetical protein
LDSSREAPSATMTCEGSKDPAEQADPLEAQIPAMSKPARSEMLSPPRTVKATVFAKRWLRGLRKTTP